MSRLDARWPLATAPWAPGCGGYAVHACRRVAVYDAAISAAKAQTRTTDAARAVGFVLRAIELQPESECVAIRAVLDAHGLAAPLVGISVAAVIAHAHERLAHEAACHDPRCRRCRRCRRRTRRARA